MTHDDMTCFCIEDIIAAACLATNDDCCSWPPDIESIYIEELCKRKYAVVTLKGEGARCIRMTRVKERAKKVGIDLWDHEPEE